VIEGKTVILEEPFPRERLDEFHHWLGVSVICRTDEFPQKSNEFAVAMEKALPGMRSWAVFNKSERSLIGIVMFEPFGLMSGKSYVASGRRAWGTGMMEEAAKIGISQVFTDSPQVGYILGLVTANNFPAKAFNQRIGMTLKDILPSYTIQAGKLRDMLIFELTRESWAKSVSQ
jgi:RimJ/RimL family protein N-acetyltransferase